MAAPEQCYYIIYIRLELVFDRPDSSPSTVATAVRLLWRTFAVRVGWEGHIVRSCRIAWCHGTHGSGIRDGVVRSA